MAFCGCCLQKKMVFSPAPVALGVGCARIRIRSTSHDCHTDYARRMPLCPWCMCGNSGIEWIFYEIFSQLTKTGLCAFSIFCVFCEVMVYSCFA